MSEKKLKVIQAVPMTVKEIGKWLRENLYLVRESEDEGTAGKFARVRVRHMVQGNKKGEEVFHVEVPKKANEAWTETAALDIWGRLQAEATTLSGLQKYALYSYFTDDNENHVSRYMLRVDGQGEDDADDLMMSEGPNKAGLTSMAMRHAEVYAKINTGQQMASNRAYEGLVDRLSTMVDRLLDQRIESMERENAVAAMAHDREIERIKAEGRSKAFQELGKKLGLFIPALANKMTGQNVFPVEANASMMMLKSLLTSMSTDGERFQKILANMTAEEQVAFSNLYETVQKSTDDNGMPIRETSNGTATQNAGNEGD